MARRLTIAEIADAAASLFLDHRDVQGLNQLAEAAAAVQDELDRQDAEIWGDERPGDEAEEVLNLAAEQGDARDRTRLILAPGPAAEPYAHITRGRQLSTDEAALSIDYRDGDELDPWGSSPPAESATGEEDDDAAGMG